MVAAINTGKVYSGARAALDLSSSILDPVVLFQNYKTRITADGGHIPDEAGCLERFRFLLLNGMYERTAVSVTPAFGIKTDGSGNVQTIYNLTGENGDLLAAANGVPPEQMLYDPTSRSVNVRISSAGGNRLLSRGQIMVQKSSSYLIAGCMSDTNRTDGNGLTLGYAVNGLAMAYMRTMIINNETTAESWRFGTRDSGWPAGNGGAVLVNSNHYEDYVPAAGLFKVAAGKVEGYERGKLSMTASSVTGSLADLRGRQFQLVIGIVGSGSVGCEGTFRDVLQLHTASEADGVLTSRIGM